MYIDDCVVYDCIMQKSGKGQSPYSFRLVGTTSNCTFGVEVHSKVRANPTKVLATPIQRTAAVSPNAGIFPPADTPPVSPQRRISHDNRDLAEYIHDRPDCSYTLLIAMALKSSKRGALPVNEIYKYIQREFPYFQVVSETWKNSVRHSLSLGRFFRKVERTGTKRGFYWEIVPGKKAALEKELERFMKEEGLVMNGSKESEAPDTCKQPKAIAATASTSPPSLKEPGSVIISSPSQKNSLKQATVTQSQQKDPPKQGSLELHNTSLAKDTFIASNVAINKAVLMPLSSGLQPSSSTSTVSHLTSKMIYRELPASSTTQMDYILMKTLAEGRQTSDSSVGTAQNQLYIQPQQSTLSLASGLEVTTPTSPWPDLPEELLSILPQCPSATGMNNNMSDLKPSLEKCALNCDCKTCKVWTPAFLQCSGEQILHSRTNMPSSTSRQVDCNAIPKNQPTIAIDLTSPVLTSTHRKCQDLAATLSIKPTKPIPLQLQYYNTNFQVYFANCTTCTPLPVNVCEPASIQVDHMLSAGRTAVNLEELVDTSSLQNSVFEVENLDEQKKGADQFSSQHELQTFTSSGMLNGQQHKKNKTSGSKDAASSGSSATSIPSTSYTLDPQRVPPLSALECWTNLNIEELVKLIEEEECSQRQRKAELKERNRKQMVHNSCNVSLANIMGAPIVSEQEELESNIPSATNSKLPSSHTDAEQNLKKMRLEEEHSYCANVNRGFRNPEQTKKRYGGADANFFDCSKWRDPAYTEEWIDHPLSTENMLILLEQTEHTKAKRGSSAGKHCSATGNQQATGMSVPAIAARLPTTLEKVIPEGQESLDEQKEEEEGQ